MIEAIHLTKTVTLPSGATLTLLDAVDFTINDGEAVAIVGASGSGKTTLLGLLAGLDLPTSGKIVVDRADIATWDEEARARWRQQAVGFVFQDFQLLSHLTAWENVALPLWLKGDGDAEKQAKAWLARVGLAERLSHRPETLSGGEQQRVALARAFACNPRYLFADEPTGNLDAATGETVIELLFSLQQESGATLVLVTHDPALAARCQRVLTLQRGRLVANDHPSLG
ncbi:MAG: ABC transporter ATP-binding protein [Hydrogenophilus thermoluteolus]|uniref:ABC transporter ATP-binding protein n=1 Tax=Hydrogenophilus thermoluteolus TaxID=297 RepID=UPI0024A33E00|nr:ATP-binding cassette domain-containing protein [Hydrogenophilus thermoluteolus]GLW60204.1 ABC transporter ATP-binding protein [Hydrogenophilus thermoluteolus]HNQ49239.1 ATP-binding cassette domain-containing protein [Hydrogenophilus thermoluteolus]